MNVNGSVLTCDTSAKNCATNTIGSAGVAAELKRIGWTEEDPEASAERRRCHFAGETQPLICGSKSPTPRRFFSISFGLPNKPFNVGSELKRAGGELRALARVPDGCRFVLLSARLVFWRWGQRVFQLRRNRIPFAASVNFLTSSRSFVWLPSFLSVLVFESTPAGCTDWIA